MQINLRLDSSAPGLEALQQQLLSSPAYQAGLSKAFNDVHPTATSHPPGQMLSNGQLSADLEGCLNGTSESPPTTKATPSSNSSPNTTTNSNNNNSSSSTTSAATPATAALAHTSGISSHSNNNNNNCSTTSNTLSNSSNNPSNQLSGQQNPSTTGCGSVMEVASPQAGTAPRASVPHHQPPPPTAYSPAPGPAASPVLQAGGLGGASPAPPPSPAALATSQRSTPTLSGVASPLMAGCVSGAGPQIVIAGGSTGSGSIPPPPRTLTPSQSPRLLNGGASTPNGLSANACGGSNTPASNPATPVPSVTSDVITPSPSPHLQQIVVATQPQQQQQHITLSTTPTPPTSSQQPTSVATTHQIHQQQQRQQQLLQQVVASVASSTATTTQTSSISVSPAGPQTGQAPQIILGPQQASILQAGGSSTILLNQAMLQQQLQAAAAAAAAASSGHTLAATAGAAGAASHHHHSTHHHHHHHHHSQSAQAQPQPLFVQSVNGQLQLIHRPATMLQPQHVAAGTVGAPSQQHSGGNAAATKAIMLGHPGQPRPNYVLAPKLNPGGGLSFQLQPASPQQPQPLLLQPQQINHASQMSTIHLTGPGPTFVQMGATPAAAGQPQIIATATPPLPTTPSPAPTPMSQTPSPAPSNSSKPPTPSGSKEGGGKGGKNATGGSGNNSQQQQNKARPSVNLGDLLKEHGILDASPPPSPTPQPTQQQEAIMEQAVPASVLEPPKKSALLERLTSAPPPVSNCNLLIHHVV